MTAHTIDQLRRAAKARLPKIAFDFVDGGAGREAGLARAERALGDTLLMPNVLGGTETRSLATRLLGIDFAAPFGVGPIGLANLAWPGTDRALAAAAARAGVPYVLSTAGTTEIEEIAAVNPAAWFQLYVGRDQAIVDSLIDRAQAAGVGVLVVTVDVPAPGKRVRDLVNGFTMPLRLTPRALLDLALHPAWCLATLRAGPPRFANYERYAEKGASAQSLAALMAGQSSARFNWLLLEEIRRRWAGKLVVKGVLNPADALRLRDLGADAVIVSNHGGRQLDSAPAPITMLPHVRRAVGEGFPVLMDGGLRSGEDIAKALALGADFVLAGRPFLYGVAALGPVHGPAAVLRILTAELDNALAQLGAGSVGALGPQHIAVP